MPRERRDADPRSPQSPDSPDYSGDGRKSDPRWVALTDTGSMEPSAEALAWQQRADAWAQQSDAEQGTVEPANRWSDVAATGRTTFPADGVGWRTETSEWRATGGSRWRQTTEWRSTAGTQVWRSTTEAWQPGAGSDHDYTAPVQTPAEQPAISGTAWPTPAENDQTPSWQQPAPRAAAESTPSWQQPPSRADTSRTDASRSDLSRADASRTDASRSDAFRSAAESTPSWQQPAASRAAPEGAPSWQAAPASGTSWIREETPSWQRPDDGHHLVREDDRAAWREAAAREGGGRRRAPEPGVSPSGGTGWATPSDRPGRSDLSDQDDWAGHTDTGSIQLYPDSPTPSWAQSDFDQPGARRPLPIEPDRAPRRNRYADEEPRSDFGYGSNPAPAYDAHSAPPVTDQPPTYGARPAPGSGDQTTGYGAQSTRNLGDQARGYGDQATGYSTGYGARPTPSSPDQYGARPSPSSPDEFSGRRTGSTRDEFGARSAGGGYGDQPASDLGRRPTSDFDGRPGTDFGGRTESDPGARAGSDFGGARAGFDEGGRRARADESGTTALTPGVRRGASPDAGQPRRYHNEASDDWREQTGSWAAEPDTSNWVRDPDTGQWRRSDADPRVLAWREEAARREADDRYVDTQREAPARERDNPGGRRALPAGPSANSQPRPATADDSRTAAPYSDDRPTGTPYSDGRSASAPYSSDRSAGSPYGEDRTSYSDGRSAGASYGDDRRAGPAYDSGARSGAYGETRPGQDDTERTAPGVAPRSSSPYDSSSRSVVPYDASGNAGTRPPYGDDRATGRYATDTPNPAAPISSRGAAPYDQPGNPRSATPYGEPRGATPYGDPAPRSAAPYSDPTPRGAAPYGEPGNPRGAAAYGGPSSPRTGIPYDEPGSPRVSAPYGESTSAPYGEPGSPRGAAPYGEPTNPRGATPYGESGNPRGGSAYGGPSSPRSAAPYGEPGTQPGASSYGDPRNSPRSGIPYDADRTATGLTPPAGDRYGALRELGPGPIPTSSGPAPRSAAPYDTSYPESGPYGGRRRAEEEPPQVGRRRASAEPERPTYGAESTALGSAAPRSAPPAYGRPDTSGRPGYGMPGPDASRHPGYGMPGPDASGHPGYGMPGPDASGRPALEGRAGGSATPPTSAVPSWTDPNGRPSWDQPSSGENRQRLSPDTWRRDQGDHPGRGSASPRSAPPSYGSETGTRSAAAYRENADREGRAGWDSREGPPGSSYRDGAARESAQDWRRDLSDPSNLADGESRRFGTADRVPFRPSGSAAVPGVSNLSMTSTSLLEAAPQPAGARPRVGGNFFDEPSSALTQPSGAYERRPVTGPVAAPRKKDDLLDPVEDEDEKATGGPLTVVGYTVIWYAVPVVFFLAYLLFVHSNSQTHALSTIVSAAPQFLVSLVLSVLVALGLRFASASWKSVSVGLAAAVVGGGLATVLSSAITGHSLS